MREKRRKKARGAGAPIYTNVAHAIRGQINFVSVTPLFFPSLYFGYFPHLVRIFFVHFSR